MPVSVVAPRCGQGVAVLADVHGNPPALEAVLAEVEAASVDRIVLLGEIALGPMPGETLDLLSSIGDPVVWVAWQLRAGVVSAYDGAAALSGVEERVVVCGHTHMPFDRLVDGRRVINPGSVGMAYGPPGAYWAVPGPQVELRMTAYDAASAAARIATSAHPGGAEWAREYVLEPAGDAEALEVFRALADSSPDPPVG